MDNFLTGDDDEPIVIPYRDLLNGTHEMINEGVKFEVDHELAL